MDAFPYFCSNKGVNNLPSCVAVNCCAKIQSTDLTRSYFTIVDPLKRSFAVWFPGGRHGRCEDCEEKVCG